MDEQALQQLIDATWAVTGGAKFDQDIDAMRAAFLAAQPWPALAPESPRPGSGGGTPSRPGRHIRFERGTVRELPPQARRGAS